MWQNFFYGAVITIGGAACVNATLQDPAQFTTLSCVAPWGQGSVTLEVDVGSQAATMLFLFDPPVVLAAWPSPADAMAVSTLAVSAVCARGSWLAENTVWCEQVLGRNFGVPSPVLPVVFTGVLASLTHSHTHAPA